MHTLLHFLLLPTLSIEHHYISVITKEAESQRDELTAQHTQLESARGEEPRLSLQTPPPCQNDEGGANEHGRTHNEKLFPAVDRNADGDLPSFTCHFNIDLLLREKREHAHHSPMVKGVRVLICHTSLRVCVRRGEE